jgi:hypothetical protein
VRLLLAIIFNSLVAVGGFECEKKPFFRLARQILQSKSGIFGEKFNEARREKGFFSHSKPPTANGAFAPPGRTHAFGRAASNKTEPKY